MIDTLKIVKQALRITWSYQDEEIKQLIEEGKVYLESVAGPLEFQEYGLATSLLKNYCLYAWSGALSEFPNNYRDQLINLQIVNAKGR